MSFIVAYNVLIQDLVSVQFLGRVLPFVQQGEGLATIDSMALSVVLFRVMAA